MASQKKEHFTSVFSNVIVQLGGIGVNFLLEMRPLKIIESQENQAFIGLKTEALKYYSRFLKELM